MPWPLSAMPSKLDLPRQGSTVEAAGNGQFGAAGGKTAGLNPNSSLPMSAFTGYELYALVLSFKASPEAITMEITPRMFMVSRMNSPLKVAVSSVADFLSVLCPS